MYGTFEEGDPGMALVFGGLVAIAVEGVGSVVETFICPGGDAARGKETRGCVWEMEVWKTGIEGAFGRDVPADSDVVETAEGEIRLPFETLDVGAEERSSVARGRYPKGGLYDLETGLYADGWITVEGEA